jgi:hypothetical protein
LYGTITENIRLQESNKAAASIRFSNSMASRSVLNRVVHFLFCSFRNKMGDLKRLNHTRLLVLRQIHLNQHENKISDRSGGFQNYRQLVRMQLDQFPVRQFAVLRWANINAMTPVPVQCQNAKWIICYRVQAPIKPSVQFFMATTLFKRELFLDLDGYE